MQKIYECILCKIINGFTDGPPGWIDNGLRRFPLNLLESKCLQARLTKNHILSPLVIFLVQSKKSG